MTLKLSWPVLYLITVVTLVFTLGSCMSPSVDSGESGGITPKLMADALHTVMQADRTVYASQVVHRLQNEEDVIRASEHWKDDRALPLPAQMFRMGAELVSKQTDAFSYSLLSKWPINPNNVPKTDMEIEGLNATAENVSQPFFGREILGDTEYFIAVYPDFAVSSACVKCHNAHPDSPRDDFKLGDTMGSIVIRIPLTASK